MAPSTRSGKSKSDFLSGVESKISAQSVSSHISQSNSRRKRGHCQSLTDLPQEIIEHLQENIESLQALQENLQALSAISEDEGSQESASMRINPPSRREVEAALHKTFRSETPPDSSYFSEPVLVTTYIGSVCILVLAMLSVDWSFFWKILPSSAALNMGEFSTLMRTWAGAVMEGLSQEFSAGHEA